MSQGPKPESPAVAGGDLLGRGATIGRYVVLGLVGRGGMGDVYAAFDPELDRKVAVKLVRARGEKQIDVSEGRSRLLREAQAIAKLSHPNVVVVYDVGTFGERVFLAMEFIEGHTVGYWLQEAPRSWRAVLDVYLAAGRGLAAAHRGGLVHRDFKPDNVMVTKDGEVRVMDFGLARPFVDAPIDLTGKMARRAAIRAAASAAVIASGASPPLDESTMPLAMMSNQPDSTTGSRLLGSKLTETGIMLGTPAYMAPEQFAAPTTDARADQFSFCVSLYESLYAQRPFPGRTIAELMASVVAGEVSEAPEGTKVPSWLRRALMRGLKRAPADRYPNMEALLAELARDPTRTRRRLAIVAGAALATSIVAGAGGAALHASRSTIALCAAGPSKVAGVWEVAAAGDTPRKLAVHRAFAVTGAPYAESAFTRVKQILDRYIGDWTGMHQEACLATHARGEQSAQVLDLRMDCLSQRLGRVKALTDLFATANPKVVENAVVAASALPALDRCADVKLLRAIVPPPDDPTVHARVETLRKELARVKALGDSGQCAVAAKAGRKLIADSHAVGYLPLEAESLNARARLNSDCIDVDDVTRMYKQAIHAATASHDEEAAVEAMILLSHIMADRTSDTGQARLWVDLAGAVLSGLSTPHPILESWRLQAMGRVLSREGHLEESLQSFRRAQDLMEKTEGADHPDVATVINNIGLVLEEMHRYDEALTHFVRAEQLASKVLGAEHPSVTLPLGNQGEVLNALHRYDEAQVVLERAISIWRRAGSSPFYVAFGLTQLGESFLGQERQRDAQATLEEALRLFGNEVTPFSAAARFALARALWANPQQRPRALTLAQSAKRGSLTTGIASGPSEIDEWLVGKTGR